MTGADLVTVVSGARGVWNVSINVVLMSRFILSITSEL